MSGRALLHKTSRAEITRVTTLAWSSPERLEIRLYSKLRVTKTQRIAHHTHGRQRDDR